jgi:cyanamide hydratase
MPRTAANLDTETLHQHGLLPVFPLDLDSYVADLNPEKPTLVLCSDIPLPDTPLTKAVTDFVKQKLPEPTFNHSMRVYYFGQIITKNHLPNMRYTAETWYILTLLHDLGSAPDLADKSVLSFEYHGGIKARELLLSLNAPPSLADSVCEAIIRHQDVGTKGTLSAMGAIIQFATLFDNIGKFEGLVHTGSVDDVIATWPRLGWSGCFNAFIEEEGERGPWRHTSVLGFEGFQRKNKENPVMRRFGDY